MRMNTNIPMMADVPDIAGAVMRGREARQQSLEWEAQNALRDTMQQYGGAAMQGDPNALAQIAQHDPRMALGVQGDRLGTSAQYCSSSAKTTQFWPMGPRLPPRRPCQGPQSKRAPGWP